MRPAHALGLVTAVVRQRYTTIWYGTPVVDGVLLAAQELGQDMTLFTGHLANRLESSVPVYRQRAEGLIFFGFELSEAAQCAIADAGIPIVTLSSRGPAKRPAALVDIDNVQAARDATAHLIGLGHRKLAMIQGHGIEACVLRTKGFRLGLADAGLTIDESMIIPGGFYQEVGATIARQLLSLPPAERPTGIVCFNDSVALGVLDTASRMHISVPGELSVIGMDDIIEAKLSRPALTTIRQPLREIGEKAVELLVDIIEGRKPVDSELFLPHELVVRGSTGPAPAA